MRIRYKDFNPEDWENDDDNNGGLSTDQDTTELSEKCSNETNAEVFEARSGNSYLSNVNIIASISDKKLIYFIAYYRNLLALCQEELTSRELNNRHVSSDDLYYNRKLDQEYARVYDIELRKRTSPRFSSEEKRIRNFVRKNLKLDRLKLSNLLNEWLQILDHYKDKNND